MPMRHDMLHCFPDLYKKPRDQKLSILHSHFNMIAKVAFIACLVAVVVADGYRPQSYDNYENINYNFKYDVKDDQHYNYQSRDEYKDGKNVYGSYSLVEPDGTTRIVKYTADDYGFHATVDHEGGYNKPSYGGQSYQPSSYKQPSYKQPSYKPQSYQPSYQPTTYKQPAYQPSYKPAYKAPAYQAPAYQAPAYQAPVYKTPAYQAPAYQAPAYKASTYQAPAYHAPSYQAPAYQAPAYQAPAYKAPAYQAPAYKAPSYQAPAYQPAQHTNYHTAEPHYQTSYTAGAQY